MCLLTYYPGGVLPNLDALANGAKHNTDGYGYAIVTGGRITVRHGLDDQRMIGNFGRDRALDPDGPALFHSRYGTHGTNCLANCHPFRLGRDRRTVLAHNGILDASVRPGKGDKRCDTRIAAEDFLPGEPFGPLYTRRGRAALARWLTPGNKIVILTVDPGYRANAYVINEKSGEWHRGAWYSNDDYREPWCRSGWEDDFGATCPTCLEIDSVDPVSQLCRVCGTCRECAEPDGYCVCYTPRCLDFAHQRWTGADDWISTGR
jgi:glutamine amidotransferase